MAHRNLTGGRVLELRKKLKATRIPTIALAFVLVALGAVLSVGVSGCAVPASGGGGGSAAAVDNLSCTYKVEEYNNYFKDGKEVMGTTTVKYDLAAGKRTIEETMRLMDDVEEAATTKDNASLSKIGSQDGHDVYLFEGIYSTTYPQSYKENQEQGLFVDESRDYEQRGFFPNGYAKGDPTGTAVFCSKLYQDDSKYEYGYRYYVSYETYNADGTYTSVSGYSRQKPAKDGCYPASWSPDAEYIEDYEKISKSSPDNIVTYKETGTWEKGDRGYTVQAEYGKTVMTLQ